LREILLFIPPNSLAGLYSELMEMVNLLPDDRSYLLQEKLDAARRGFEIENLEGKKIPAIFTDLFRIANDDFEDEDDELEVTAIEYHLLDDKRTYEPYIKRLKAEFPELYALHSSFFDEFLRTRDPEKMLHQRSKKFKKMSRHINNDEDYSDSEQPETVRRSQPKVGRNDPCPCGSGKKYKRCCGA
jgi:preprotein translocase subunit SecA